MAAPQGTVRVRQQQQTITFRVEGQVTMFHGPSLRRFAEQALAAGARILRVDLRACTYMDSTFLGTLLFLKHAVDPLPQGELTLVSPSPECFQSLHQMAVDKIIPVVKGEEPDAGDWTDLPCDTRDLATFKRTVVQAHQELAGLPGSAGESFREAAHSLTQELKGKEGR